ncbi:MULTISPECIES: phosphotransferase [unclassified Streptomyces]|uniref:phosphotransferase n=1 Tax=unclassified Streptomyces TaxID=2593676 RepID=UPI00211A5332|nr:phosphotransferase [Streptomyces sp. 13-12-16]
MARLHAVEVSGDASVVEGPLQGYHHETYVFPLPGGPASKLPVRWKCREPRENLLWFDRRCFSSEEELLRALSGRISRIPDVIEVGRVGLQRFIEGETLAALHGSGRAVPDRIFEQIIDLFGQMARVESETLVIERRCDVVDRPTDGDTNGFLERLVHFTEERVYQENLPSFDGLFSSLGVTDESFKWLRKNVSGLHDRPFFLLHADLHRENFIVDPRARLWVIDWELAMLGDPLYDLATHLYLMRYPKRQEEYMAARWRGVVERVRPGSSRGMEDDLSLLVNYKKAQSVFTDVIRSALSLESGPEPTARRLVNTGEKLHRILAAAAAPLGLESVPAPGQIASALDQWRRAREQVTVSPRWPPVPGRSECGPLM